jgi:AcrR family transcriptional regulator
MPQSGWWPASATGRQADAHERRAEVEMALKDKHDTTTAERDPGGGNPGSRYPRRRKSNAGRKPDVTPENWLDIGLRELGRKGPGSLRLDALCKKLGITKGSFYWYFSGRDDFMRKLLQTWEERETLALIEHVEKLGGTPSEKLHKLFLEANSGRVNFRTEQAIRHWGHSEPAIRAMLHKVDHERIEYLRRQLTALTTDAAIAEAQATLLYSLIFGEAMIYRREERDRRRQRQDAAFRAIMRMSAESGDR